MIEPVEPFENVMRRADLLQALARAADQAELIALYEANTDIWTVSCDAAAQVRLAELTGGMPR